MAYEGYAHVLLLSRSIKRNKVAPSLLQPGLQPTATGAGKGCRRESTALVKDVGGVGAEGGLVGAALQEGRGRDAQGDVRSLRLQICLSRDV